ncbi:glycosyltransferase family 2 protein [Roseiarcus sp.]|uniref:glycosyltransferase family 2 protein n=1 Tax=Roseiarcus sp. TaxID=1969460 RepID=UPI003F95BD0D
MRIGDAEAVVSVVIPCLDEEVAIGPLVEALRALGTDEVIVVDGGSRDRTIERAKAAGAQIVVETHRGYGRACAAGVAAARPDAAVIAFMDGDGSDDPAFVSDVVGPVLAGEVDFCMGSRLGRGSDRDALSVQQRAAGRLAGLLMRVAYSVRFTDMSPFRAIRCDHLKARGMTDATYGWNLEMQMRVAARRLRIREVPVACRRRIGGESKVSGNLRAALPAALVIVRTFLRLAATLRAERVT